MRSNNGVIYNIITYEYMKKITFNSGSYILFSFWGILFGRMLSEFVSAGEEK